jgi:O-antigen ligase
MPRQEAPKAFYLVWLLAPLISHPLLSAEQFFEGKNALYYLISLFLCIPLITKSANFYSNGVKASIWSLILYAFSILLSWTSSLPNQGLFMLTAANVIASFIFIAFTSIYKINVSRMSQFATVLILVSTANGLAYSFTGRFLVDYFHNNFSLGAPVGPKSFLAIMVVQLIPIVLVGEDLFEKIKNAKLWIWACRSSVFLGLLYIFLIRSRTAWVATGFYALIMLAILTMKITTARKRPAISYLTAFVLAIAAVSILPTNLNWKGEAPYVESLKTLGSLEASSGRDELWKVAWLMFSDSPINGIGSGQFPALFSKFALNSSVDRTKFSRGMAPYPANDYLHALAERGLLGGLAFFLWVLAIPSYFLSQIFARKAPFHWPQVLLISSALGSAICAIFNGVFSNLFLILNFVLVLTTALSYFQTKTETLERGWKTKTAAFITVLSVLLLMTVALRFTIGQATYEYIFYSTYRQESHDKKHIFEIKKVSISAWPWAYHWNDLGMNIGDQGMVEDLMIFSSRADAESYVNQIVRQWPDDRQAMRVAAGFETKIKNFSAAKDYYRRAFLPLGKNFCNKSIAYSYYLFLIDSDRPKSEALTEDELGACSKYVEKILKNPQDA